MADLGLLGIEDPRQLGLLSLGLRLMSTPGKFGTALGQSGLGALGDMQGARQAQQKQALLKMQMDDMKAQQLLREQQVIELQRKARDSEQMKSMIGQIFSNQGAPSQYGLAGQGISLGGVSEPMRPQPGGLAGTSLDTVAALHALGGPDLLKAWEVGQSGVKQEAGNYYTRNGVRQFLPKAPDNMTLTDRGEAVSIPGAAEGLARAEGLKTAATEGAKAWWAPGPTDISTGQTVALGRTPGFGPPAEATQSTEKPVSRKLADKELMALYGDKAANFDIGGKQWSVGQSGGIKTKLTPTEEVRFAADKVSAEGTAKSIVEMDTEIRKAGMDAPIKIAKYQRIGTLLEGFEGGKFSQLGKDIASAANSAGFKLDPKLPNKEAAETIYKAMALESRNTASGAGMPGAMSDADREFLLSMQPQMSQTAEGRRMIVDAAVKIEQRRMHVAEFARKWKKQHGKLDDDFFSQLQAYAEANPMFGRK